MPGEGTENVVRSDDATCLLVEFFNDLQIELSPFLIVGEPFVISLLASICILQYLEISVVIPGLELLHPGQRFQFRRRVTLSGQGSRCGQLFQVPDAQLNSCRTAR